MSNNNRIKANIFGVAINSGRKSALLTDILSKVSSGNKPCLVFTPNPAFILQAQNDVKFKELLNQADINLPDGFGFILFNKILKWGINARVAGSDIVKDLLTIANKEKWRVGLAGMRNGVVSEVNEQIRRLKSQYPNVVFFDLAKHQVLLQRNPASGGIINTEQYQLILACHGMGKQEKWIWENKDKYNAGVMMGVGGSLDFLTGFTKRAPVFIQKFGLEWLWRVGQKPSHYKRALQSVFGFSWLVVRNKLSADK